MASGINEDRVRNTLVLSSRTVLEDKFGHFIESFTDVTALSKYICNQIKNTDTFHIHVSNVYLKELIKNSVHKIEQVRRIYVYYDTNEALQSDQSYCSSGSAECGKFELCLERNLDKQLENAETGGAVDSLRPIDRPTLDEITEMQTERISKKRTIDPDRHSSVPKRFASAFQDGYIGLTNNNSPFICSSCNVFFHEPYQLECEHRLCKFCVDIQNR
jgi:hypothetical protein